MYVPEKESLEVPFELQEFARALDEAHTAEPFSTIDYRRTADRVLRIASEFDLGLKRYRGKVSLGNASIDSMWLCDDKHIVDVANPVLNDSFRKTLPLYIGCLLTEEELEVVAINAPLSDRIIGAREQDNTHYGSVVFHER